MSLLDDPICPICQEDMYSNEGIYFCKKSCGHNFHIGCLQVFIKHKKDTDTVVSCPMCRAKWEEDEYIKPLTVLNMVLNPQGLPFGFLPLTHLTIRTYWLVSIGENILIFVEFNLYEDCPFILIGFSNLFKLL